MEEAPLMREQCRLDTLVDKYRNTIIFYFKLICILKVSVMSVIVN